MRFKLSVLFHVILLLSMLFGAIPNTMEYQGKVTNSSGVGINDTLPMTFRLYGAETGGSLLWTETHDGVSEIPVFRGFFDALLGSINPINLPFDGTYWLQVIVDGDSLAPRVELTPSPYAFRAKVADSLTGIENFWSLSGNGGIIEGVNFIGTTDNKSLCIRTNNTEKIRLTPKGQIQIFNTGNSVFIGEAVGNNDDLSSNENTAIGYGAFVLNTSGESNTVIGAYALGANNTGMANTAIGHEVLAINDSSSYNTVCGSRALWWHNTGDYNSVFGFEAGFENLTGSFNTLLGYEAGYNLQHGNMNTYIGVGAGKGDSSYSVSGNVFIGYMAGYSETDSNRLYIENSNSDTPLIYGKFDKDVLTIYGDVGIGTPLPKDLLHIYGGNYGASYYDADGRLFIEDDNNAHLNFLTPNDKNAAIVFGDPENHYDGWVLYDHNGASSPYMTLAVDDQRIITLKDTYVGIGITNPKDKLEVNGDIMMHGSRYRGTDPSNADSFWIYDDGDTTYFDSENPIKIGDSSLIVKTSGDVHITGDLTVSGSYPGGAGASLQGAYEAGNTITMNAFEGDITIQNDDGYTSLFIKEATGEVGIGTANPRAHFQIGGDSLGMQFGSSGTSYKNFSIRVDMDGGVPGLRFWNRGYLDPTGSHIMTLDRYGNVGIGMFCKTPSAKLELIGDFMISSSPSGVGDRFRVTGDGKVGINNNTPSTEIHVKPLSNTNVGLTLETQSTSYDPYIDLSDGTDKWTLRKNFGVDNFYVEWNGSDRLTIEPTGEVGVGVSAPRAHFQIGGDSLGMQFGSSGTAYQNFHIRMDDNGGVRGLRFWNRDYLTGDHIMTLTRYGNVGIGMFNKNPDAKLSVIGDVMMHGSRYWGTDASGADSFWIYDDGDTTYFDSENPIKIGDSSLIVRTSGDVHITGDLTVSGSCPGGAGASLQGAYEAGNTITMNASEGDITIQNDAAASLLFLDESTGYVGIGITSPSGILHVDGGTSSSGNGTDITLEAQDGSVGFKGGDVVLMPGSALLGINGGVGIGTIDPRVNLHIYDAVGPQLEFEEGDETLPNGLWRILVGQGELRIAQNTSVVPPWSSFQIRMMIDETGQVGIGTTNPQGSLDVNGAIYQRGALLHADYVFEPDYELESIGEHAEYMWREKHLKAVPKEKYDENGQEILEVGAHRKGMLEELEKAHIYISQLDERNAKLKAEIEILRTEIEEIKKLVGK